MSTPCTSSPCTDRDAGHELATRRSAGCRCCGVRPRRRWVSSKHACECVCVRVRLLGVCWFGHVLHRARTQRRCGRLHFCCEQCERAQNAMVAGENKLCIVDTPVPAFSILHLPGRRGRRNGGVSKIPQNDVLEAPVFTHQVDQMTDLVGTRPWRRACNRALPALRRPRTRRDAAWKQRRGTSACH